MATIRELSDPYTNLLLRPEPGAGVCDLCFNLTDDYRRCYACDHLEQHVAAMAPISYSVAHEQLHHVLAGYKRWPAPIAAQPRRELAAILWRYLLGHESCLARAAGIPGFDLVTTVPAGTAARDEAQPLRYLVADLIGPTRVRYRRLLLRTEHSVGGRRFDSERYVPVVGLTGETVLLIDDTWTTGASAQSAAAALVSAGAGTVAALAIGRHVNRDWRENNRRLGSLQTPYDWGRCVYCAPVGALSGSTVRGARTP